MSKIWKKRILCLAIIVICLASLATGTMAYFVAEETAYNVITTGCLFMDLVEETEDGKPWPEEGVSNVVPATSVGKVAYVENKGSVPFFTRALVETVIYPAPGVDAELKLEYVTLDLNTEFWTEWNGFYYYNRILQPGEKTEPLFTKVSFAPEMGNEYMNAKVEVLVLAQAVQSANNGTDPLYALGWSESVKTLIMNTDEIE